MNNTTPPHELPETAVQSLQTGQCILLLGQQYLSEEGGENRFFETFREDTQDLRHETDPALPVDPYSWWLRDKRDLAARERCILPIDKATSPPDGVASYLRLPWRAVFSSAFDGTLRRLLELSGRRTVSNIWSPEFGALATGSDITLGRLFGSIERHEHVNEAPPLNHHHLRQRRTAATAILLRLRELLPPRGTLLIDGWDPRHDWLRPRDLAPALQSFLKSQVVIFGLGSEAEQHLHDDDDFDALLAKPSNTYTTTTISTLFSSTRLLSSAALSSAH